MGLKEMKISSRLKGGIYEVSFGYHSKLDGICDIDVGYTEVRRHCSLKNAKLWRETFEN